MFANKYKKVRTIGRGGFADVYMVYDQNGNEWAAKQISKIKMKPQQKQYIDTEIKVMEKLKSQYIVQFHDLEETKQYYYMIIQYCNGGDLKKYMMKRPNQVFGLQDTARILADVIRGLEVVHTAGFLHRDIKIDNILVKIDEKQNKIFKIADFGLSKDSDRGLTVLGTINYMSPELFAQQEYGFEVDMWAFAVVMYFMMNKQFPFKLNPHFCQDSQIQFEQITKQAANFSYSQAVHNSKHKFTQNCTDQVEDLFSRMFEMNPNKRITFSEIRTHPIFKQYFPEVINQQSQIMYKSKTKIKPLATSIFKVAADKNIQNENVGLRQSLAFDISKSQKFPKEKELLFHLNNQIQFLYANYQEFNNVSGILTVIEKAPLCYNLLKYYIFLKRKYIQSLRSSTIIQQYPQLQLTQYFKTGSFKTQFKIFQEQLDKAMGEFQILHSQCDSNIDSIDQINNVFKECFNQDIKEKKFDDFKKSYRKSTLYAFNKLKKFLKQNNQGNKTNYFLALVVISHVFNRIFAEKENIVKVFKDFFESQKFKADNINYDKLRQWMSKATSMQLNAVTRNIINTYFERTT